MASLERVLASGSGPESCISWLERAFLGSSGLVCSSLERGVGRSSVLLVADLKYISAGLWLTLYGNFIFRLRESSGDDHFDLESPSHLLVKDGGDNSTASTSGPSHRWRSIIVILHVRQAFISSARNKSLAVDGIEVVPPPPSIATSNTGDDGDGLNVELAIISTSPEVSLDVQSDGADESNKCNKELQNAEIARIVKAKDLNSLREFGGVQGFAEALDTDLENGLANDEDEICCRRLTCPQSETKPPQEGFFHILWNRKATYRLVRGAFIICAIIVLVSVPMIREYWYSWYQPRRKKLSKNREIAVHVFRGGSQHQISISNVVSGDIMWLKKGDQIPADGLFIFGESLKSDDELESTIDDQNPFMFYGAKVINGEGKMLVVSIGKDTVWGEMMSNVINASNPLQVQLDQLNSCIQIIGVLITIIICTGSKYYGHKYSGVPVFLSSELRRYPITCEPKRVSYPAVCGRKNPPTVKLAHT
ncbi:hypothetical protein HYC85_009084 [Camellia sinensis]|uniref:P-type ATPase A domain-containing protein n=1 Tax=Camellia sinensis TaxID=4442 RepID=A0A7J7HDZ9_CAMSI|nr:hypothetical protein HYC85_009084 [Camellia sinensis]